MTTGTIAGLLHQSAQLHPHQPLLIDPEGAVLTVSQVAALSAATTHWLAEAGVRPGITVGWQLPTHAPAIVTMLALAHCNVVQAPLIHIYRAREVAAAVEVADIDLLIVDESTADQVPKNVDVARLPQHFLDVMSRLAPTPHPAITDLRAPHDPRWLYFTSGTTGRPKAVRHTDATLLTAARGYRDVQGLGDVPDEVGAVCFPLAHIGGIVFTASALLGRFPFLLIPRFEAAALPYWLARHHVTVTGGSSAFYQTLLSEQVASGRVEPLVPSLRMLTGGGAPCPPELHKRAREVLGVPILHAYGMTEAAMVCVSSAADADEQRAHTSGAPVPGIQVRVSPTPGGGRDGEIEIRGPNLTPGYIDPDQWAHALTADGWFRTGDLGHLRPDGHLVLTGRSKDLIVRKGENIVPTEIENELLAHPLVDDVVVIGLPDELRGELVCAVVRRSRRHRDVTLEELCTFLDERGLMKQKWPERLAIVDDFPLTGLGKVAKDALIHQIGVTA